MWSFYLIIIFIILVFSASFICTYFYRIYSAKIGIISNPNYRTLHENKIPLGGGLVFSSVYFIAVLILWLHGIIESDLLMVIGLGGLCASIFGFIDDIADVRAYVKFIIQSGFAVWILAWFDGGPLVKIEWVPTWFSWVVSLFLLIWMMNLYNFMDGVDGMAASGAVFISTSLVVCLFITVGFSELVLIFSLLASSCLGFLRYNWPPASIFMGDSGSIFLGYIFGALMIYTTMMGEISIWTWIVVFGYFFADTNLTILLRILLVKKWYHAHKSHAYQNLARVLKSHVKVTTGVLIYQILYLFPISIWTVLKPEWAPFAGIMALLPIVILTLYFGPKYSSD